MIYYVFADTHIEGVKNTSKGYYHSNKIKLKINASYTGVNRASYQPQESGYNYFTQVFEYNFINAHKGKDSEREPYIGEYSRISAVVFEYDNYKSRNKILNFDIEYSGEIYRKSKTKSDNYTMERTISHRYRLKADKTNFEKETLSAIDI